MIAEGAEWRKALAAKPHDLSSVLGIYIVEEANLTFTCAHTQAHNIVIV